MNKLAEETKVEKEVTEEVEENKEAEAEVVEEEKVDQEDQIKILHLDFQLLMIFQSYQRLVTFVQ